MTKTFGLFLGPDEGELRGWVKVHPTRNRIWEVQWDIGSMDEHYELSDHWFSREEYFDELFRVLEATQGKTRDFRTGFATVRWGSVQGLSEDVALEFAKELCDLWNRIIADWRRAKAHPATR